MTSLKNSWTLPGEWEKHKAVWLAWPSDGNLWKEDLILAQKEFVDFCHAIVQDERDGNSEQLEILVPNEKLRSDAKLALEGLNVRFHLIPFGDIWLRDTGPLFLKNSQNEIKAFSFRFNGWGEKYILPHDSDVSMAISKASKQEGHLFDLILEGGSIESDGEGTLLTTRQCLLNPNRNPSLSQEQIETELKNKLNIKKVLWLDDGLINDHTDGHIDTLARFISPGEVVCMQASSQNDPNYEILEKIATDLSSMTDACGRQLKVHRIPSPGKVLREIEEDEFDEKESDFDLEKNEIERIMPASFVNFYIGNKSVVVPTYGTPYDDEAVKKLSTIFSQLENHSARRMQVVGVSAKAILSGGGAFHCISQQQPC